MPYTEQDLRTKDIRRPEPLPAVLDALEARGHARNGFCERCWADSYFESIDTDRPRGDVYLDRLAAAEKAVLS